MEFILAGNFFLAYWDFLDSCQDKQRVILKSIPGISEHIWQQIPESISGCNQKERIVKLLQ
jgi:hypothetical protein